MSKKFLAAFLFLSTLVFANWDGSVKKPSIREIDGKEFYEIATPENLAWFAVQVNKGKLNYNAVLVNDIVVWDSPVSSETIEWTPIGVVETSASDTLGFRGIFDGNGHKVSGIYVPEKKYRRSGFFSVLNGGAVVKNLTIENALIQGDMSTYFAPGGMEIYAETGGIAGIFDGDSIVNCEFHGTVIDSLAGGLVGKARRTCISGCGYKYPETPKGHAGVIANSRNYGNVKGLYVGGGLVGTAYSVDIIASENFGNVTGAYCGGISGFVENFETTIDGCINHATIATTDSNGTSGGIVSEVASNTQILIRNTVNDGNVYSGLTPNYGFIAGGFVGVSDGKLAIENCVNNGTVTRSPHVTEAGYAGGFVGYAALGSVDISGSVNKGFVDGKKYSGGFVGKTTCAGSLLNSVNEGNLGYDSSEKAYNAGFISSVGYKGESAYSWKLDGLLNKVDVKGLLAGGIVALAEGPISLLNSVNEGDIEGETNACRLGGLIAVIRSASKTEHEIRNVVNKGNISYSGDKESASGGIVGVVSDSLLVMDNAVNYGNFDMTVNPSGWVDVYVGGIVGNGYSKLKVMRSVNHGNIHYVENGPKDAWSYIGGIAGFSTAVEQSSNFGSIYAKSQTPSSKVYVAGITANSGSVNKSVNEGRLELVGSELLSGASVAGIATASVVTHCINKGNLIQHWSKSIESSIGAIQCGSAKGGGNYSIADTVMANEKMVAAVKGCNFADKNKLGLEGDYANALTTKEMQSIEFAWHLNTCGGTASNSGGWSQKGTDYPVFSDDQHHPIYKVNFIDSAKVINVKTYTVGTSYTDDSGHFINMPKEPNPEDAGEDDLKFGYWGSWDNKAISAESIINSESNLYAFYIKKETDPTFISFVVDGKTVATYVLSGSSLTITLPDAAKNGRKFLGWYNGGTLVGAAGVSKKFTTAMTLVAQYENLYYSVQFLDQGIVLQGDSLRYGALPEFKGEKPISKGYDFVGWTPEIAVVTGDAKYFANYVNQNASSSSMVSSSSAASSSSARSSSSTKSSSSQLPMSSGPQGDKWVVDALGGVGNFDSIKSLDGWTLRGGTELVENNDGAIVLQVMSDYSGRKIYEVQAKYPVYLQKGHSYKIKGSGYPYDDLTWDTVYVGLMAFVKSYSSYAVGIPDEYHVYFEHEFKIGGAFESKVYNHCEDSKSGEFYINGGARLGGFAIENVVVEEREIQCPGTVYASQLGFQKDGFKELVVEYGTDEPLQFIDESGKIALSVPVSAVSGYAPSNQWLRHADFSKLTVNGTYMVVQGKDTIYKDLSVTSNTYEELLKGVLKFYYYQRASMDLEEKYAGVYARAAGHPDTAVYIHSSTGDEGVIRSSKGWYDAGDYGKYTVNAGIATYTLLSLYEHFPKYFKDLKWNIPADGNLPDLLAEIKYNLDWMLTMQAKDGGVYHKLSAVDFPNTVMPVKDDSLQRYIIGKSVTAAYDFAAVMAAASRVYKGFDASYAKRCLDAAELAYRWAESHPNYFFTANPAGVKTGAYEDADATDERQFAATELYVATGNPAYKMDGSSGVIPSWQNVYGLATYEKSNYTNDFGTGAYTDLIATADRLVQIASTGFGVPMSSDDFVWGSNGVAANQGVWLLNAYYLTGKEQYYNTAVRTLDYLVGKNPLRMSYVTGFGTKSPQNPHHRISQADGVKAPVPGMLVGGPQNNDNSDKSSECSYTTSYPAISYYDNDCSYTTNEVAINWNAPLAYLAGALEALASGETPTFAQIPAYSASSSSFVASSSSAKSSSSAQVVSSSSAKSSSSVQVVSSSSAKSSSSAQVVSSSSVKPSSSAQVVSSSSAKSSSSAQVVSSSSAKSSSSVASSSSVKSSSSRVPSSSSMVPSSSAKSSSSSKNSSSSKAVSSSSAKSSSSSKAKSSSSKKTNVVWNTVQPTFILTVNGMTLILSNTQGGVVRIFDALGHLVVMKPLDETMTSITLQTPGNYIVRVNGMNRSVTLR